MTRLVLVLALIGFLALDGTVWAKLLSPAGSMVPVIKQLPLDSDAVAK